MASSLLCRHFTHLVISERGRAGEKGSQIDETASRRGLSGRRDRCRMQTGSHRTSVVT